MLFADIYAFTAEGAPLLNNFGHGFLLVPHYRFIFTGLSSSCLLPLHSLPYRSQQFRDVFLLAMLVADSISDATLNMTFQDK